MATGEVSLNSIEDLVIVSAVGTVYCMICLKNLYSAFDNCGSCATRVGPERVVAPTPTPVIIFSWEYFFLRYPLQCVTQGPTRKAPEPPPSSN